MKYTREMLEKMPIMRLRKAAKEAGFNLNEIMRMDTKDLIETVLESDGCDHDCSQCDHSKHIGADLINGFRSIPTTLDGIDRAQNSNPFAGFADQMRSFLASRQGQQPQMAVFRADSMAGVAKKIVELQEDVIQPRQLAEMLLKIPHPKLRMTPFWHIQINTPAHILDSATIICCIDPLIFEAAGFTMKELRSMMTKEVEELKPYLPDMEFKVQIKKEVKQVLGYLPIKPKR